MELVAADRPGLLSKVGKVFVDEGIDIDAAKIMTIGERAEDVFYISTESGTPLDETAKQRLSAALRRQRNEQNRKRHAGPYRHHRTGF